MELVNSQNKWRRLVKEHYSLIGKRREQGPFCAMLWGGMRSEELIRRVGLIGEYQIPLDYVWVDAGWYGIDTLPTNSEFEGDWHMHTGDWTISPLIHPQAMQDVSHKIKEIGKEFLLWVEPERVKKFLPIVTEHPEYFLESADERDDNVLLNLGCPAAYEYCLNTLSDLIEKLNIGCYRQDFISHRLRTGEMQTKRTDKVLRR